MEPRYVLAAGRGDLLLASPAVLGRAVALGATRKPPRQGVTVQDSQLDLRVFNMCRSLTLGMIVQSLSAPLSGCS